MINNTTNKIISYISKKHQASGHELSDYLGITPRAVRKQLKSMLDNGLLNKIGKPPKVFYFIPDKKTAEKKTEVRGNSRKIIEKRYLIITPSGEIKEGMDGFEYWCIKNKLDIKKTATEYIKTLKKYDRFKKDGLIDGKTKMKQTFNKVNVDKLYYLDFYSIERFGKTKMGQLLLYAKQSQDKKLIKYLSESIIGNINNLIKKYEGTLHL